MTDIVTKTDLIAALKDAKQRAAKWFEQISAKDFFTRQGEVWSASDNVDHLIRSHKPIIKAFRLPRITLQAMFGKPDKPSMRYEEICQIYRAEIAKGAQASGSYLPDQQTPADADAKKREILERWSTVSAELIAQAEKWDENELDQYQLPHPLLGKLTIREILFFTVYHNLRHASLEGD